MLVKIFLFCLKMKKKGRLSRFIKEVVRVSGKNKKKTTKQTNRPWYRKYMLFNIKCRCVNMEKQQRLSNSILSNLQMYFDWQSWSKHEKVISCLESFISTGNIDNNHNISVLDIKPQTKLKNQLKKIRKVNLSKWTIVESVSNAVIKSKMSQQTHQCAVKTVKFVCLPVR